MKRLDKKCLKTTGKWAFRAYIAWSICADIILIAGMTALLFGDIQIVF